VQPVDLRRDERGGAWLYSWIAQVQHDGLVISIEANHWPITSTRLTTITDLQPYVDGAREVRTRWPTDQ
jgi:hypothetical protein